MQVILHRSATCFRHYFEQWEESCAVNAWDLYHRLWYMNALPDDIKGEQTKQRLKGLGPLWFSVMRGRGL